MHAPVFFDATGRRRRWSIRMVALLGGLFLLSAVVFAITLIDVPTPRSIIETEWARPRPLAEQVSRIGHKIVNLRKWLPHGAGTGRVQKPLRVGFYAPWDDASRISLAKHIGDLDWVVPGILSVAGPDHQLHRIPDPRFDHILQSRALRPAVLPMVQNARDGLWDDRGARALLASPVERQHFVAELDRQLADMHAAGVVFDIENLDRASIGNYLALVRETRRALAPEGRIVTVAVPVDNPDWNLKHFAAAADKLFIMDYDEHEGSGEPGPIASQAWFVNRMKAAVAQVGHDKAIVAIGNYGYDWVEGGPGSAVSVEEAWLLAHDSGAKITFDQASGNQTFDYEEDGKVHHVWMLDATSAWNQLRATQAEGVAGVALWRLGTEDTGIWDALAHYRTADRPNLAALHDVGDVDVEGSGEIFKIDSTPSPGARSVVFAPDGLITDEVFHRLPTPFVVRRTADRPGNVAITFDDGPDPDWTPPILKILREKNAPATFFVIGENALAHPGILRQIIRQGSEIGNHSYTHPNLANASPESTRLELNATQRLVEAYTGHGIRLFRAPYFGDAEPTTADELLPALEAQNAGYVNVGLHVDPGDWKTPGADFIVNKTLAQVEAGNDAHTAQIVLLHDGGGNRAQTLAALPRIIDGLRARGYHIVPVSELAGLSAAQVMPPVKGADLAAVRADMAIFTFLAGSAYLLKWLFFVAIALGTARAVLLAALAWTGRPNAATPAPPPIDPDRFVSVLIPAFNEAKVIGTSVARVLASRNVRLEVIVIDDGSSDGTGDVVTKAFGDHPQVRLLSLPNGGKAAALNHALRIAQGEIIVALDADTQFEPETIARLARWFAEAEVGAVAGNAMVGNQVNLVTRWQGVEYITAQNLERRALERFDAVTVVPGAVGAWRRAALDDVGGYPVDTLAEDQDLTIAIQRRGWRIALDTEAVAWTEAPESFGALAKQRFRWAFGTLQCLWKHRSVFRTGQPIGLAWIGLPQAWLFQIGFAIISPVIDLALLLSVIGTIVHVHDHGWAQTQSDVLRMGLYWMAFAGIDICCGWLAYRLEPRAPRFPALLLVAQRFIYRQIMYTVVLKAVSKALTGPWVGWGKLERSGRVGNVGLTPA
ncbi:glycosyltransferase [Chakrabartia godavariana]|nr:glycosyltransferase [Chakrabartia godavariana]